MNPTKIESRKITVTWTYPDENEMRYPILYEETDIREACKLNHCKESQIEECVANMKDETDDCICCYVSLVNELHAQEEYGDLIKRQEFPK